MMSTQQQLGVMPLGYPSAEMAHQLSRQMSASDSRRLSRGSNGQRTPNAMRVAKPSSANNSPRSSMGLGRRRTLMNDGNLARRQQVLEYMTTMPAPNLDVDPSKRSARPVSWHPSSHLSQQQYQHHQHQPQHQHHQHQQAQTQAHPSLSQYPFPGLGYDMHDSCNQFPTFSPMPSTYSCDASPSAFSPLTLPVSTTGLDPHYLPLQNWNLVQQHSPPSYVSAPSSVGSANSQYTEQLSSLSSGEEAPSAAAMEWSSFAVHGFCGATPPTPEAPMRQDAHVHIHHSHSDSFSQSPMHQGAFAHVGGLAQQPQVHDAPAPVPVQVQEDEDEDDGEILVGMGLYDAPDKYDLEADPQLTRSRSSMTQLLGAASVPEPQVAPGKGLKLEETWQPPESDDEEDEDDSEENDEDDD